MFENIIKFLKKLVKAEQTEPNSKDTAKERLHLVLMQDRANVSADFLELMKQEIIEVIKKYIEVEEESIDVRLTNEIKEDGTTGSPSLYANIPIVNIKKELNKTEISESNKKVPTKVEENKVKKEEEVKSSKKNENQIKEDNKNIKKADDEKKEEIIKKEKPENDKTEGSKTNPKVAQNNNSNKKSQTKKTSNNNKKNNSSSKNKK
jgi:cell division topological specificity factor